MKKRRAKLYLVGQDPADIFDDLDKLKSDLTTPPERRARATETFARIPHDKALALHKYRLSSAAWVVLIELDRLILKRRGQNPVRFASTQVARDRDQGQTRTQALRQLAGRRGPGRASRARFGALGDPSLVPSSRLRPCHPCLPPPRQPCLGT